MGAALFSAARPPLRPDEDIGAVAGLSGRRHADEARNADVNRSCSSGAAAPVTAKPIEGASLATATATSEAPKIKRRGLGRTASTKTSSFPGSGRNLAKKTPPRSPCAALTTAAVAEKPGWPPYEDGGRRRFDCPLIPPRSRQRPALVRRAASAPTWGAGPPNGRSRTPDRRGSWCRNEAPSRHDR